MIQLDTHVLLWREIAPERLSPKAASAIETAVAKGETIAISALTLWEIAALARKNRISLQIPLREFLLEVEELYHVLPVSALIAAAASEFPDPFPKDPMDHLIAATALCGSHTLITADRDILASNACILLW